MYKQWNNIKYKKYIKISINIEAKRQIEISKQSLLKERKIRLSWEYRIELYAVNQVKLSSDFGKTRAAYRIYSFTSLKFQRTP